MPLGGADAIGSVVIKFLADVKGFTGGTEQMSKSLTSMRQGLDNFSTNMRQVGTQLLGFGTALATPLIGGVKAMMDFDDAFQQVASIMKNPLDMASVDRLKEGVLDLSKSMGVDAVEATRGLYQALSSGVPEDNVLTFLQTASKAAIAGNTDLFSSVSVIAGVVNAYGADVLSAEHASDLMFQTVKDGMIEFKDLAEGMGQVSAMAAQAGVSFEEINAALATMTQVGLQPAESFTALRGILTSIISPSKEASKAAEELGIDWSAAALKSKGWAGMMEELRVKTGENVEAIARLIPEVRGMNGALLVGAQNGAIFARELENMKNATGATDKAFAEIEKSLQRTWEKVKTNLKAIFIEIGEALRDDVSKAFDEVLAKAKEFQKWIGENPAQFKEMVSAWKDWTVYILGAAAAFLSLSVVAKTISNIAIVTGAVVKGWKLFSTVLASPAAYNAVMALGGAIESIGLAIAAMSAAALAAFAVIGVGLTAIGISAYKTYQAQKQLTDSTKELYETAEKAAKKFGLENDKVLKGYADGVKNAKTESERFNAMQEYSDALAQKISEKGRAREAEFQKQMTDQVTAMGRVKDVINITDAAWMIHKDTGVNAATAVQLATKMLADSQSLDAPRGSAAIQAAVDTAVDAYNKLTDSEKKALVASLATTEERRKFAEMSAADQQKFVEDHLKSNEFMSASDAERATIMELYRNKEISIDQAVLAVKKNLTNEEIALLEQGANALDVINARKKASGDEDSKNLAEKFGKDKETLNKFVEDMQTFINELERKREELNAKAREAAERGDSAGFSNFRQQEEAALQQIIVAQQKLMEVRNSATENMIENAAKERDIEFERAAVALQAGELEAKAIEERKTRLGATFEQVLGNLGQYKAVYDQLSADQKVAVDALIANVLDAGIAINSTQKGIADAQSQAAEAARNSLAAMSNTAVAANQDFQLSFTQQAETLGKVGPQLQESINSVTTQIATQRAEVDRITSAIADEEQVIWNLVNAEGDHSVMLAEHKAKLIELTGELPKAREEYDTLTAALSGNRTQMMESNITLNEQIRATERDIEAKRASGGVTTELQSRLVDLNAQYDVLKVGMEKVGLTIEPVTAGMNKTKEAAGGAAQSVGELGTQANATAGNIEGLATATRDELPQAVEQGLTKTQSAWERFANWFSEMIWGVRRDAAYAMNPDQTGSPSLNMEIVRGLGTTERAYAHHAKNILTIFSQARSAQVNYVRDSASMLESAMGAGGGGVKGVGGRTTKVSPEKHNTLRTTVTSGGQGWVQLPDGSWIFTQGLESYTYEEPIPNPKKPPTKISKNHLRDTVDYRNGSLSEQVTDRIAEIFARIEERLARLRDPDRYRTMGKDNEWTIPDLEQDSLAEKIGEEVGRALVAGGRMGIFGPAKIDVNLPPPPPVITHTPDTSTSRRFDPDRYTSPGQNPDENRRRFY